MSNIYRVIDEEHLFEILINNMFKVVVASFTSKINDTGYNIKKCMLGLSSDFKNSIFLYIDVDKYKQYGRIAIDSLPTTIIFFQQKELYKIMGKDVLVIEQCFKDAEIKTRQITLKMMHPPPIQQIQQQMQQPMQQQMQQPMQQQMQQPMQQQMQQPMQQQMQQPMQQPQKHVPIQLQMQLQKQQDSNQRGKPNIMNVINKLEALRKTKEKEEEIIDN
jgi:hypothetical protein